MKRFTDYTEMTLGKSLASASKEEIYLSLLSYVKEEASKKAKTQLNVRFITSQQNF